MSKGRKGPSHKALMQTLQNPFSNVLISRWFRRCR